MNAPISIRSTETSVIIHLDKTSLATEKIQQMIQYLYTQTLDVSHIPFADDEEQREIEELLKNPECHIYDDEI